MDVLQDTAVEIFEAKQKALVEGDQEAEMNFSEGKDVMSILCQLYGSSWLLLCLSKHLSEGKYECFCGR